MTITAVLSHQIADLPDDRAVAILALVLRRQGLTVDPFTWPDTESHLREALAQPEITHLAAPAPNATAGSLARMALTHIAMTDDNNRDLVEHALTIAPRPDRFDPATLVIGGLVLLAFRADFDLAHKPGKGWTFRFRTRALPESTIGELLRQLLGNYLNPKG
ncbi:hypothetical protein ONA91_06320 [Micromonospora sp. DR5-3]|uniref:hypothetical protein n=1 Tax=unclassified Micromonospora TaxID=2617518 RepID=UPI0011D39835|nr:MULTISPECIES: hypothetical protein [unclassified Micromonospora]MCW3814071.1 hypothetical protein [Micromonospora sp. DR5-3]TYC23582.1 hypothetical protein FXF52_14505 [Micromonospora sp. MP36]